MKKTGLKDSSQRSETYPRPSSSTAQPSLSSVRLQAAQILPEAGVEHSTDRPEESRIALLTWWNFPRNAWFLILAQLVVIIVLGFSLISEYFSNIYYRNYINSISPILVPVLSIGFGAGSATIALKLYLSMQKIHATDDEADYPVRKRPQSKRTRRTAATPAFQPSPPAGTTTVTTPIGPVTLEQKPVKTPSSPVATTEKKETPSEPGKPGPNTP